MVSPPKIPGFDVLTMHVTNVCISLEVHSQLTAHEASLKNRAVRVAFCH